MGKFNQEIKRNLNLMLIISSSTLSITYPVGDNVLTCTKDVLIKKNLLSNFEKLIDRMFLKTYCLLDYTTKDTENLAKLFPKLTSPIMSTLN